MLARRILLLCVSSFSALFSFAQNPPAKNVKLVNAQAIPCDDTYNPARLINRITDIQTKGDLTTIMVSFIDNCCVDFKPEIEFKENKLILYPYRDYSGDVCECACCFAISFQITGLAGHKYDVYLRDQKIERSDDYYKVVSPTHETYKGKTINRTNRYGFKEGVWMTFDNNKNIRTIDHYPEAQPYQEQYPVSKKRFYESGSLAFYYRPDTVESWFEDGGLRSQSIEHKVGDTTYIKIFKAYEDGGIQERRFEKRYPAAVKKIFHQEYFPDGQRKFLYGVDSSFTWYESGKIAAIESGQTKTEYDEDGHITRKIFTWKTNGPAGWSALNHTIYATFTKTGSALGVHYVRDEIVENGIAPAVHYEWKWNDRDELIDSPEGWQEQLPWKSFPELGVGH